jgi:hypothetical protein
MLAVPRPLLQRSANLMGLFQRADKLSYSTLSHKRSRLLKNSLVPFSEPRSEAQSPSFECFGLVLGVLDPVRKHRSL